MGRSAKWAVEQQLAAAQDNLHRAECGFQLCSPEQMNQQYGQSGMTRAELLAMYRAEVDEWAQVLVKLGGDQ